MKNSNNQIEAPESDYLYKSQSQIPNAGDGLFTVIDIYKEETIAIFKGEILSEFEAKIRADAGNDGYFINLLDGSIMDSGNVECFAKYANDAEGLVPSKFKNNARITLDLNDNVCIEALRNIRANEELFCSYGKGYWKKYAVNR
jgi:uncharacterized protein